MQLTPIHPDDFQKRIELYAQDIVILWDTTIERYRIYQHFEPLEGFIMHDMTPMEARRQKLRLMFTIQESNGDYRDPDEGDLQRVIEAVTNTINLSVKGYNHITDLMEKRDIEAEEAVAPGVKDAMEWGAKEIFKARTQKGILGL